MKNKILLIISLILFASVLVMAAAPASGRLIRLEMKNKTHLPVRMSLLKGAYFYYLTVDAFKTKTYTIEREEYKQTTYACNYVGTGTLDATTNLRLIFTSCYKDAPNPGEPTMEKIHFEDDSPWGVWWRYQH